MSKAFCLYRIVAATLFALVVRSRGTRCTQDVCGEAITLADALANELRNDIASLAAQEKTG